MGKAFTRALDELNDLKKIADEAGSTDDAAKRIADVLHEIPTVKAFLLMCHVGDESAIKEMRVFPCIPSKCTMTSMSKFFEDVSGIADLVDSGRMTEDAFNGLEKVFKQLGHINANSLDGPWPGTVNLNMARGAVGVISVLKKVAEKKVISGFEVTEDILTKSGDKLGTRTQDIVTTDGTLIEVKGWKDKQQALIYLLGKEEEGGGRVAGKLSAQIFKDIVKRSVNEAIDKRIWMFSDEALEAGKLDFANQILKKIVADEALAQRLTGPLGFNNADELMSGANLAKLRNTVGSIFGSLE